MKILVSAYACRPHYGSEQGAGWEWVKQIARFHSVWVLTSDTNRSAIENESLKNVEFIFLGADSFVWLKKLGLLGHYVYYYLWHYVAYRRAIRLHEKVKFDLVHQITFGTFRIPAFVSKLPVPSVWGPIGGGEYIPARFWAVLGRAAFGEILRTATNPLALWIPGVRGSLRRAVAILAVNNTTLRFLPKRYRAKCRVIPIVGEKVVNREMKQKNREERDNKAHLLFVGKLEPRRTLALLLKALHQLGDRVDFHLRVIGEGPEKSRYGKLAKKYGLSEKVSFVRRIPFEAVYEEYARADILCSSSLRDSGGSTYVGAMASGLPIVCIDHAGPGELVGEDCGIKISLGSPGQVVNDLAIAIERLAKNPALRHKMGAAAQQRVNERFDWDVKGAELMKIYDEVCAKTCTAISERAWQLRGEGGANWKYLLPIHERSRLFSTELLDEETIASLARSVGEITIACQSDEEYRNLSAEIARRGLLNVSLVLVSTQRVSGLPETYDIVLTSEDTVKDPNSIFQLLKCEAGSIAIDGNTKGLFRSILNSTELRSGRATAYIPFPSANNFRLLVSSVNKKVARKSFELHNTMKFGNRIKKSAAIVLSSLGLLSVVAPSRFYILTDSHRGDDSILLGLLKKKFASQDLYLALHPGSHGKSNKAVVQVMNSSGAILAYAKVADNEHAWAYLRNECEKLQYLGALTFEKGEIPSVIDYVESGTHTILLLSVPLKMGRLSPIEINSKHLDWLQELSAKTEVTNANAARDFVAGAREGFKGVLEAGVLSQRGRIIELFEDTLEEIFKAKLKYSLSQRDFTPWNIRIAKDKIFVLDWEWAKQPFPPLQDFFHFGYQACLRVKNLDSVESARRLLFQHKSFGGKVGWMCRTVGIDSDLAYPLFVFYAFDWLMRGVEIGSRVIVNEQTALLNALIERNDFSRNNFSVSS